MHAMVQQDRSQVVILAGQHRSVGLGPSWPASNPAVSLCAGKAGEGSQNTQGRITHEVESGEVLGSYFLVDLLRKQRILLEKLASHHSFNNLSFSLSFTLPLKSTDEI